MASTLRLPADVEQRLAAYCTEVGATKNRVCVIALRSYLEDRSAALPVQPPSDSAFESELVRTFNARPA